MAVINMKKGEIVDGKYKIVKWIGRGGNGIVYEVDDINNKDVKPNIEE